MVLALASSGVSAWDRGTRLTLGIEKASRRVSCRFCIWQAREAALRITHQDDAVALPREAKEAVAEPSWESQAGRPVEGIGDGERVGDPTVPVAHTCQVDETRGTIS